MLMNRTDCVDVDHYIKTTSINKKHTNKHHSENVLLHDLHLCCKAVFRSVVLTSPVLCSKQNLSSKVSEFIVLF